MTSGRGHDTREEENSNDSNDSNDGGAIDGPWTLVLTATDWVRKTRSSVVMQVIARHVCDEIGKSTGGCTGYGAMERGSGPWQRHLAEQESRQCQLWSATRLEHGVHQYAEPVLVKNVFQTGPELIVSGPGLSILNAVP
ncbi:hypothetical protein LIA77_02620 [Sarocladium implicatum]|nr:hypothetical protein LIA77_02620 [Sarocladium implicatum]